MKKSIFVLILIVVETILFAGGFYLVSKKTSNTTDVGNVAQKVNKIVFEKDVSNIITNSKLISNSLIDLILSNDDIGISELLGYMKDHIAGVKNIYLIDKNKKIIGATDSKKLYANFTKKMIPAGKDTSVFTLSQNNYDIATAIKIGKKRLAELHATYEYKPPKINLAKGSNFNNVLTLVIVIIVINVIILFLMSFLLPKGVEENVAFESADKQELKQEEQKLKDEIQEMEIKATQLEKELDEKNKELVEINEKIVTSKEEETAILKHIEELQQREEELAKKTSGTTGEGEHLNVEIVELQDQLDNLETEIALKQKEINKLETNIELLKQELETLNENKDKTLSELNGIELDLNKRILMKRREEIKLSKHLDTLRREEEKIKSLLDKSKES